MSNHYCCHYCYCYGVIIMIIIIHYFIMIIIIIIALASWSPPKHFECGQPSGPDLKYQYPGTFVTRLIAVMLVAVLVVVVVVVVVIINCKVSKPNRGLESSLCRRTPWPRLTKGECFFTDTGIINIIIITTISCIMIISIITIIIISSSSRSSSSSSSI